MALCLGAAVAYGSAIAGAPASDRHRRIRLVLVLLATTSVRRADATWLCRIPPRPRLSAARCVIADDGYVAIYTHTLVRSLKNGCRVLPNPRSNSQVFNAASEGPNLAKLRQDQYQQYSLDYYRSADVVLLSQLRLDGLTDATRPRSAPNSRTRSRSAIPSCFDERRLRRHRDGGPSTDHFGLVDLGLPEWHGIEP